jgi:hypothetical protein
VRYFHGGVPGLALGDRILPPTVTGAVSVADYERAIAGAGVVRRDRVFLTTLLDAAILFAALHPSWLGEVYEVDPEEPLEPDPDYMGGDGASWQAPAALVVRRLGVPPNGDEIRGRMLQSAVDAANGRKR